MCKEVQDACRVDGFAAVVAARGATTSGHNHNHSPAAAPLCRATLRIPRAAALPSNPGNSRK